MCKTKIIATLGPASQSEDMIRKLILAGVNIVRLNFSHGSAQEHIDCAKLVRRISAELGKYVGVLVDLQGPKIRIACFKNDVVELVAGQRFVLDAKLAEFDGSVSAVGLGYPDLIADLNIDDVLLLDDGRIHLQVTEVSKEELKVTTKVLNSGKLSNRKGINLLGGGLSAPALTPKDIEDMSTAALLNADFLAISFPRNAQDIHYARKKAKEAGCDVQIIAKVERAEVVASEKAMDEMIQAADIIMVARGDLGVEIGDARLARIQKQLISRSKYFAKPVITATQMMESMIENPMPTRAEVLDIANAVMDGSDAIMLSAESAAGRYPVEAVQAMVRIAAGAEEPNVVMHKCWADIEHLCQDPGQSFALSAMLSASQDDTPVGMIIISEKGQTPRIMSRCQSSVYIWAVSDDIELLREFSILRGVKAVYFDYKKYSQEDLFPAILAHLKADISDNNLAQVLFTQCQNLEKVGDFNVCRMISLSEKNHV
ncbi:pyruvate kinase [Psychromonas sp. CNPT3]|uniref:pyruvate kinase n=1 Tax=Psychromonas sp. CNPT3 TaxID=314282 RepID=UPI00006E7096|nr:pyruvate kinase [Psychromonas sp. CNPT3]AGH80046.1 pyruvate kinase [Psychromonas sp. CNPT3]